jgi:hypothetical protein
VCLVDERHSVFRTTTGARAANVSLAHRQEHGLMEKLRVEGVLSLRAPCFRLGHLLWVQMSSDRCWVSYTLGRGRRLLRETTSCRADPRADDDFAHPPENLLPVVDEHQEHKESETR